MGEICERETKETSRCVKLQLVEHFYLLIVLEGLDDANQGDVVLEPVEAVVRVGEDPVHKVDLLARVGNVDVLLA